MQIGIAKTENVSEVLIEVHVVADLKLKRRRNLVTL